MSYHLANLILLLLPPTRFFALKRILLRWLAIDVGRGTRVCGGVRFYGGGRVKIGQDCWIGIGARFYTSVDADIEIGDRCDIAPEVSFMCGSHELGTRDRRAGLGLSDAISVGSGTWIGIGSTLLGGTQVGASSLIAAKSLLLGRTYPDNAMLVGAPAAIKRLLD